MNIYYKVIFLIFLFLNYHPTFSQQKSADVELVNLANEMFSFGDKKDALAVYLQAVEFNPNNISANLMAGRCYIETINKELSVSYLIRAYELDKNVLPDILFKIGQGYQFGSRFDDAIKYYEQYKQSLTDEKASKMSSNIMTEVIRADRKIFECLNGKKYYASPQNYIIENLKDVVNSEFPDYVPSVTADQSTLIFTSRRAGGVGKNKDTDNEFFEDIWISKKTPTGEWGRPTNVGPPINTISHDANVSISPDGKRIFIFKPDNEGDLYECDIKPDGKWSQPKSLGSNINTKYRELSVTIAQDGKTLYFSSNREGGFGGIDLYKSRLDEDGKWGPAENLGSAVNTEYDEDAPFIDSDGKTLYFSSQGHKGIGGYDIYKSTWNQQKRTWTEPINMGYPLNSPDHDIYFVLSGDKKSGYYASAKGDGFGDKDIYKIYLAPDENDMSKLQKDVLATQAKKQQEDVTLPVLSLANKKKQNTINTDPTNRVGSVEKTLKDQNLLTTTGANLNSENKDASTLNLPEVNKKSTNITSKDGGNTSEIPVSSKNVATNTGVSINNKNLNVTEKSTAEKLANEKLANEKLANEKLANEKLANEKLANEKLANEKLANEKLSNEKLSNEKLANEKLSNEKLANEKLANEKLANEKLANEKLANEKLANEKLTSEKLANEKLANEKLANEKLANEKLANEKLANEKLANEKLANEKLANEKLANEKLANEKLNTDKLALEKLTNDKLESQKLAKEEAARVAAEKLESQKLAKEEAARVAAEKLESQKLAKEEATRIAAEKLESQKLAKEEAARVAAEKLESQKLAKEEAARIATEKLETQKLAKQEAAKVAAEKLALQKQQRAEATKLALQNTKNNAVLLPTKFSGNVYNQKTSEPLVAHIVISDLKGNVIEELDSDQNGNFSTQISTKLASKFTMNATKDGYIYSNTTFLIPANSKIQKNVEKDIAMKQIGLGQMFVLRNIYYDFDKPNIKKESFQYLDKFAVWLKKNPTVHIEIAGHTDNNGMERYNKVLSQNRVNAVMLYLTAKGISPERLTAIGYGEEQPLASNDDENEGREINRRTEFKITKE